MCVCVCVVGPSCHLQCFQEVAVEPRKEKSRAAATMHTREGAGQISESRYRLCLVFRCCVTEENNKYRKYKNIT